LSFKGILARLFKDFLFLSIAAVRAFRVHFLIGFFTFGLRPDGEAFLNHVLNSGSGMKSFLEFNFVSFTGFETLVFFAQYQHSLFESADVTGPGLER
jgi:hypothetical protein